MWDLAAGPFLAAAGLLVVAGFPKVLDPLPLVRAMRAAGMPVGRQLVRAFAVGEVLVGLWALASPSRLSAALVAAAYLAFTGFVVRVVTRGGVLASCGCFGTVDAPATWTHAVLTAAASVTALAISTSPPRSAWSEVDPATVTTVGLAALIGFLAWQTMAVLPTLLPAAIRGDHRTTAKG